MTLWPRISPLWQATIRRYLYDIVSDDVFEERTLSSSAASSSAEEEEEGGPLAWEHARQALSDIYPLHPFARRSGIG